MSRLDAVGDLDLREALLFVRARPRPVTADELAGELEIARSVARWRLEKLAAAGFLQTGFERRTRRAGPGAGRPAKTYAPAAETSAVEFPPRHYETLVALLTSALPRRRRKQVLNEVGAGYAQELAVAMRLRPVDSVPAGLRRVCGGLGRLGFHAAVSEASADGAAIVSATCPLRPLVVGYPEAAAIDEGMWCGLISAATTGRGRPAITCSTHDCLETGKSCRILVQFEPDPRRR